MKRLSFFIALFFVLPPISSSAKFFKNLDEVDGLAQTSVMSIYQDKLGRMWFGTREGISVYNGREMVNYKPWAYQGTRAGDTGKFWIGNLVSDIAGNEKGDVFISVDNNLLRYDIQFDTFEYVHKQNVVCIAMDNNGNLWSVCGDSLSKYDVPSGKLKFQRKIEVPGVYCMLVAADEVLWLGAAHGLYRVDGTTKTECVLAGVDVRGLFESSGREIWAGTVSDGVYRISGCKVKKLPYAQNSANAMSSKDVRCFVEDKRHNIWMGTFDGLQKYNPSTGDFTLYTQSWMKGGLRHSSIFSLSLDRQGTLWIGTYYGGVNYSYLENEMFKYYPYNPDRTDCISFPLVGNMTEDSEGNLWICLDGGGLACLDRKTDKITTFKARKGGLYHDNLKAITYDAPRNTLYIGTHKGGLCRYNLATGQFYNYLEHPPGKDSPADIIDCLCLWKDYLLVGARNGLFRVHRQTNKVERISTLKFTRIAVDNNDRMWGIISNRSFVTLDLKTLHEMNVDFNHQKGILLSQVVDGVDRVYIGSIGGGLYVYYKDTHLVENYTVEKSQLISNYCYSACRADNGDLLLVSDRGITLFTPRTKTFRSLELKKGLNLSSIVDGCGSYVCEDGRIFIGGTDGMISFQETDFDVSDESPLFYLSSLQVNNKEVHPNDGSGILSQALPLVSGIELSHTQNNLAVGFASSNYVDILSNSSYEYRLEGLDKEWISTDRTELFYTNLSVGYYVLRIREISNSLQTRAPQEIALSIYIHPAWYDTWWAYCLFVSMAAAFGFWLYRVISVRHRLLESLNKERMEKKYMDELNQAKLRFFTNVSHEFRTPLTLITTQVDVLLQNHSLPPVVYNILLKISKHTRQMRNLISELLDFRKLDQSCVSLKLGNTNMDAFLREICLSFTDLAAQRNIFYQFKSEEEAAKCWIDHRQLEKVFTNLLSNAFKFTPDGGTVSVTLQREGERRLRVVVADTGKGIRKEDMPYVFNRFYQAKNMPIQANPGTGIGLALVKNIIELHHGTIEVQSEDGEGSKFVVTLFTGQECFQQDGNVEWITEDEAEAMIPETRPDETFVNEATGVLQGVNKKKPSFRLLIVEDNEDLLKTLEQLFAPYYEVTLAHNGREGRDLALEMEYDLILSDVMMPEMSGVEMCAGIKGNINMCHIPVVLLTALDSVEQNIDGLRCGADDYITKPFNGKMLLMRCNNIVRNRLLMQERFAQKKDADVSLLATNPLDKKFLDTVMEVIEANLDKEDFDVPALCLAVGMSRTLLQTKFKALTNMPPNEFIINHKIKIAATLLASRPDLTIADIADKLGFSSPRYFSKTFKVRMNIAPQEYRKNPL